MARSRNLKPGFFTNDKLAEVEPLGRILFAGLWTLADREGRLECRVKRIKAAVLAYDNADVGALLDELQKHGFIVRYMVGENEFIQVLNFAKHQNPHCNETASTIPAPDKNRTNTEQAQDKNSCTPADSLLLIPDSLLPLTDKTSCAISSHVSKKKTTDEDPLGFSECWKAYPKRQGGNSRPDAVKAYRARLKAGVDPADLLAGVQRYATYVRAKDSEGTEFVKLASTFFGTGQHWKEPWTVPVTPGVGVTDWRNDPTFRGCN